MRLWFSLFLLLGIQHLHAQCSSTGLLPVRKNNEWALINHCGKIVLPFSKETIGVTPFRFHKFIIHQSGKSGLLGDTGNVFIPLEYDTLVWLSDRTIVAYKAKNAEVYSEGEFLRFRTEADSVYTLGNLYVVRNKAQYALYNQQGSTISTQAYDSVVTTSHANILKVRKENKYGLMSTSGKGIPCVYDSIRTMASYFICYYSGKKKFFNFNFTALTENIPLEYDGEWLNDTYGITDTAITNKVWLNVTKTYDPIGAQEYLVLYGQTHHVIVSRKTAKATLWVDNPCSIRQQYVYAQKTGMNGVYTLDGTLVVPPEYDAIETCSRNWYIVRKNNLSGILSEKKTIVPVEYNSIVEYDSVFVLNQNNRYSYYAPSISLFQEEAYDFISAPHKGVFTFRKGSKFGVFNRYGKELFPPEYDSVSVTTEFVYLFKNKETTVVSFNDSEIEEQEVFQKFRTLRIGYEPKVYKATATKRIETTRNNFWYYDVLKQKFGYRVDSTIHLQPVFDGVVIHRGAWAMVSIVGPKDTLYGLYECRGRAKPIERLPVALRAIIFGNTEYCIGVDTTGRKFVFSFSNYYSHYSYQNGYQSLTLVDVDAPNAFTRLTLRDEETGKLVYGAIQPTEIRTIFEEYDEVFPFESYQTAAGSFWFAKARKGNSYGYIDGDGSVLVQFRYGDLQRLRIKEDVVVARRDTLQFNFINESGTILCDMNFEEAEEMNKGVARVKFWQKDEIISWNNNYRYNYVTPDGKLLLKESVDSASLFEKDVAFVKRRSLWGIVDKKGEVLMPYQYSAVGPFSKGLAWVKLKDRYGYVNARGELLVYPRLAKANSLSNVKGVASVSDGRKYGIMDTLGNWVVRPSYYYLAPFDSSGFAVFRKNRDDETLGLLKENGKVVLPQKYQSIISFSEELAAVKYRDAWGYVTLQGKWKIKPEYEAAYKFKNGEALVREYETHHYFLINKANQKIREVKSKDSLQFYSRKEIARKQISDTTYRKASSSSLKLPYAYQTVSIRQNGTQKEVWNTAGNYRLGSYTEITEFNEKVARVAKTSGTGLVDFNNKMLINTVYDRIEFVNSIIVKVYLADNWGYYNLHRKEWVWKLQ